METPAGSFYRGGYSLTPTLPSSTLALTPPATPSSSRRSLDQKLDFMISMFMDQKKTVEDTKAVTDELQKQVVSLSSEMLEVKNIVENLSSSSSRSIIATRKKSFLDQ